MRGLRKRGFCILYRGPSRVSLGTVSISRDGAGISYLSNAKQRDRQASTIPAPDKSPKTARIAGGLVIIRVDILKSQR